MKLIIFILHQIMCSFWLQLVHSCYRKLVHCKLPITKGQIVEEGTHEELVIHRGYYYNLVRNQLELEK
jgi:ABC-type bacteriocin/lantibiotic exporter with double-glycine peptidase domain